VDSPRRASTETATGSTSSQRQVRDTDTPDAKRLASSAVPAAGSAAKSEPVSGPTARYDSERSLRSQRSRLDATEGAVVNRSAALAAAHHPESGTRITAMAPAGDPVPTRRLAAFCQAAPAGTVL
jgi:hypothetical protein